MSIMKRLAFLTIILFAIFASSCDGPLPTAEIDKDLIVGRWMTSDEMYFEVYNSDGTGKEWDLKDDVQEDEAIPFTWEFSETSDDSFIKYYEMEIGGIVSQYCNILELSSTKFKYNNEGLRATYNLIRAN